MSHDHAYNRLTAAGSDHTGPHRHPFNTSHLGQPLSILRSRSRRRVMGLRAALAIER